MSAVEWNHTRKEEAMTERQKDFIIRNWNVCDRRTQNRLAAEFFGKMRNGELRGDWWQFLERKLSTLTWNDYSCDTESRKRSAY